MSSFQGYERYKQTKVETADSGQLLLMTYDWAIKHCRLAKEKIDQKDIEGKATVIYKAQDAIIELMCALNFKAGTIASSLYRLYEFMNFQLTEANIKNDKSKIDFVIHGLSELKEAWVQCIEKTKSENKSSMKLEAGSARNIALVG